MAHKSEDQPLAAAGFDRASILGRCDTQINSQNLTQTQAEIRNSTGVHEAKLELLRESVFENLGASRLFIETAQLLIEARDDTGMSHAVKMGGHHYRAAVVTMKELVSLKLKGGHNE